MHDLISRFPALPSLNSKSPSRAHVVRVGALAQSPSRRAIAGLSCLVAVLSLLVAAQRAAAGEISDRVHINAHLTQAWGITDGVPFLGLDDNGTFDYRTGALLMRFDVTEKSSLVLQLAHERIGKNPSAQNKDDIEVDWLFYQGRWDSGTRVRVGRLPIPYGIYNELRDVGTILEFYRPPVSIYLESAFASETLDGFEVSQSFGSDRWPVDVDVYVGAWDRTETVATEVAEGRAEEAFGTQIWVGTPVTGLRFGLAHQRFTMEDGLVPRLRLDDTKFEYTLLSVEGDFDRFKVRAEYQESETEFVFASESVQRSYYGLASFRVGDRVSLSLQREFSDIEFNKGPFPIPPTDPYLDEWAVSVVYKFSPQALIRAEYHEAEITGSIADVLFPTRSYHDVGYGILSFSASF